MPFATGLPATKSAHVIAARLRERIVRGEVALGDPLPVEAQLEKEFGASRTVLREALRILENEGLVEVRRGHGGGPRVRHPTIASAAQAVGVHLQLRDVSIQDVWESYTDIAASALARLGGQGVDVGVLGEEVDELDGLVGDSDGFNAQMVHTTEEAVRLAGNTTSYILVGSLRQIILAELGTMTRATNRTPGGASAVRPAEEDVVASWRTILKHVRAHRGRAAADAFREQAAIIEIGVANLTGGRRVIDIFPWYVPRDD